MNGCTRTGYGVKTREGGVCWFKKVSEVAVLSENGVEFVFHYERFGSTFNVRPERLRMKKKRVAR